MEEKIDKLSNTIVEYSLKVKKDECVLINGPIQAKLLITSLIKNIKKVGGHPFVDIIDNKINTCLMEEMTDDKIPFLKTRKQFNIDMYDSFINIRYNENEYEENKIDSDIIQKIGIETEEIDRIRINERKWVLLNYPSLIDAYKAKMKEEDFINYAFDVMNVDYSKMYNNMLPLKKLMEKTDKVRIISPNTNISFSIKNIPIIPCCGKSNIPDGEIFTSPVKNSVNGTITYNTPCPYQGSIFTGVSLTYENGRLVECHCNEDNEKLKKIFDTDEGAKYIGEFSLGLNCKIIEPMGDILYDEKIIGSIHFTPGRAYEEAFNGNTSAIHWDMVLVQRIEHGGGEIYFDDILIRKDGKFVLEELKELN